MKKIVYSLMIAAGLFATSCEDEEVFDFTQLEEGAVLTTIAGPTGVEVNVFDPTTTDFSFGVRYRDFANNDSLESMDIYLDFIDATPRADNTVVQYDEILVENVPASSFTVNADGFPEYTYSINGQALMDLFGLDISDISVVTGGDQFRARLVAKLKDGREFTSTNVGNNVATTSHNTPFAYGTTVICGIDDTTYFTGTYLMEQIDGTNPFFAAYGQTFGTQTVEITNPLGGTGRTFSFLYYPLAFGSDYRMDITLVCGRILMESVINSGGLGCGDGNIGGTTNPDVESLFDLADDSVITLNIRDFSNDAGCGTGSYDAVLRLTKQ